MNQEKQDKEKLKKKTGLLEKKAEKKGDDIWDEIVNTVTNDKEFIAQVVGESTKDSVKNIGSHPVFNKDKKPAPQKPKQSLV